MGTNLKPKDVKAWLLKNGWKISEGKKHFTIYHESKPQKGIRMNFHRSDSMSDDAIRQVAKELGITKHELAQLIRSKTKFKTKIK